MTKRKGCPSVNTRYEILQQILTQWMFPIPSRIVPAMLTLQVLPGYRSPRGSVGMYQRDMFHTLPSYFIPIMITSNSNATLTLTCTADKALLVYVSGTIGRFIYEGWLINYEPHIERLELKWFMFQHTLLRRWNTLANGAEEILSQFRRNPSFGFQKLLHSCYNAKGGIEMGSG